MTGRAKSAPSGGPDLFAPQQDVIDEVAAQILAKRGRIAVRPRVGEGDATETKRAQPQAVVADWKAVAAELATRRAPARQALIDAGVAQVQFRHLLGRFTEISLIGADGKPQSLGALPEGVEAAAVAQMDANPGGGIWREASGRLDWVLSEDVTVSLRDHPSVTRALVHGEPLPPQASAAAGLDVDDDEAAERPRVG